MAVELRFLSDQGCRITSYAIFCLYIWSTWQILSVRHLPVFSFVLKVTISGICLIYWAAFHSLWWQVNGLIGPDRGLLPLDETIKDIEVKLAANAVTIQSRWLLRICLCLWKWAGLRGKLLKPSYYAMLGMIIATTILALPVLPLSRDLRLFLPPLLYLCLYILYYSFRLLSRDFLSFQWDVLLLESGLLAVAGAAALALSSPVAVVLSIQCYRLTVMKLMFGAGICKLASQCSKWGSHKAMHYHFWTQPLPNSLSWYMNLVGPKEWISKATLWIECCMPILIFTTDMGREIAGAAFILLMMGIMTTGNFGFFTQLTIVIAVPLQTRAIALLDCGGGLAITGPTSLRGAAAKVVVTAVWAAIWGVYSCANMVPLVNVWRRRNVQPAHIPELVYRWVAPLHACNLYGLFANMTTFRWELIIEESYENPATPGSWVEVSFRYKPTDVNRRPSWLWWGDMPRLDWRMWFLPLRLASRINIDTADPAVMHEFFPPFWHNFIDRIQRRQPDVMDLLGPQSERFDWNVSPSQIRVRLFTYHFVSPRGVPAYSSLFPEGVPEQPPERMKQLEREMDRWEIGAWWVRRPLGVVYHRRTDSVE